MLDSRAGEPNWGPEILARHASVASLDNLQDLFRGWERWAADVSESHSNYPVLIFFRSQEPTRNWLIGLLSVMDSAALHLSLNPSSPPRRRPGWPCGWGSCACGTSRRPWAWRTTRTPAPTTRSP